MGFSPREGTADAHSLVTALTIGQCFVQLDALQLLLNNLKQVHASQRKPGIDFFQTTAPLSPEPPASVLLTPTTPRSEPFLYRTGETLPTSALLLDTHQPLISPASPLLQVLSVCHSQTFL